MRFLVLASDYDDTLAQNGRVDGQTIQAIEELRHSGRKFLLVTGRELVELHAIFPGMHLCDRVVAENGAILYNPQTEETRRLATRPPDAFIDVLRARGATDLYVGEVILATWRRHEQMVLEGVRDSGLALHVILNKDSLMILPAGVDKASGLRAALDDMRLSLRDVVGIGDAENDHALLQATECSFAVANALPSLKEQANFVTAGNRGDGVREVIAELIANDLAGRL